MLLFLCRARGRSNKNNRLDRHRSWYISNRSPFLCSNSTADPEDVENGRFFRHLQLPPEDSVVPLEVPAVRIRGGMFVPSGHRIHPSVNSQDLLRPPKERKIVWQPAGPLSERRSSAAAALLQSDATFFFRIAPGGKPWRPWTTTHYWRMIPRPGLDLI